MSRDYASDGYVKVLCDLERRLGLPDSLCWASEPGVARQLLTFLASPRKVSKRRRPEVRRPAKTRGTLRYSKQQAAAELGLVDMLAQMVVDSTRPQTVLAECPCRFCVTRRLASGPARYITTVAQANYYIGQATKTSTNCVAPHHATGAPCEEPSSGANAGDVREDCLSGEHKLHLLGR